VQAQSALIYGQWRNPWGSSRIQTDIANANTGEQQLRLQLDHDWSGFEALRLSNSLSLDRQRRLTPLDDTSIQSISTSNIPVATKQITENGIGMALNAQWDLSSTLALQHSLQTRYSATLAQHSLSLGLQWHLAPHWSVQANAYSIQGKPRSAATLAQSPLTIDTPTALPAKERSIFIALRYEGSAGQARAPIGGTPGSAAGGIKGSVYLDNNKNQHQDASETGATNLSVVLDGRYSIQTDAQGKFAFNYVVAGPHTLEVISDNLPLPWQLEGPQKIAVQVHTREITTVNVGAVKP
jgi:hypothetical protein